MAKKMKLMPLFQELKGRAEISNRRPTSTGTGVYLMKLRQQSSGATLPRRRLVVAVNPGPAGALPHPVKINHVGAGAITPSAAAGPEPRPDAPTPQVRPHAAQ